jgi:OOP family OmpA-OmpF porin
MNRLLRPVIVAALGTAASGSVAHANVEIGGTAGLHVFSDTNELGVPDVKDAPSERNSALFGLRLGFMFNDMLGIEGEFGVIPSEARVGVFDVWNITYRAHLIAQFGAADPAKKLIPFVLAGGGAMQVVQSKMEDVIAKDTDAELYVGVGAKYRVDNGWGLRADARVLFPPSSSSSGPTVDFEALLGIYKEFGRKVVEKAVEQPSGPKDSDGDGIPDDQDKCPNEPEDKDGFQDDDGCPDPDNDGDGVPDAQDKCPMQAEDKDGFQDDDGCPDPDNDNDGVLDAQDKCPDQPETKNGYQDDDGCPDEVPAKVKQFTGAIAGINFKVNSADLLPASNKTLDKAVAVLKEFPDLKMEIQGHTDDQPLKKGGKFEDNQALSQARAETVANYFIKAGIDQSRITAKGYGDTIPVEDPKGLKGGKLNAARAKNRRVEFKLVSPLTQGDQTAAPTPPPPPAPAGAGSGSGK